MTIPNKITISRLFLTALLMIVLFWKSLPFNFVAALMIFVVAMFTDVLDGYIARKFHMISEFGTFLDPLVDKLIILLAAFFLQSQSVYPLWLILALFTREIIVDAFRGFAVGHNIYVGAIKLGKIKALLQTFSLILGFLYLAAINNQLTFVNLDASLTQSFSFYAMLIAFVISVIGLIILFKRNWSSVFRHVKY